MGTQLSNKYKDALMRGQVDFSSHTFKACLMGPSFIYNPTIHDQYSLVSAYELATAGGYTHGGAVLTGVVLTRDDVNNKTRVTWNNLTWTASGGDIGPASGIIIIDDSHANDIVIGFLDFGANKTTLSGGAFTATGIAIEQL